MAEFTTDFLYLLGQSGQSPNGKVVQELVPNSTAHSTESINDGTLVVGEQFTTDFINRDVAELFGTNFTYIGTDPQVPGIVAQNNNGFFLFSNEVIPIGTNMNGILEEEVVVCFLAGTMIRCPEGERAVETLAIGDLILTVDGRAVPIMWLGHRKMNCRAHPDPRVVFPIRIAADAFGPGRPSEDLYLSSGHSVCVDLCGEVLIPVGCLINGSTIAQIEMDDVTYWHVELDCHDILIANNLPAESYIAMGNRGFFEEAGATLDALDQGQGRTYADFCRPVVTEGPVLSFARQRLMERAEAIGWTPSRETDLRLMVDGEVHRPVEEGGVATFRFPASASDVRLMSNTFIPALVGSGDPRELGVCITGVSFSGDDGDLRPVSLDDERLKDGLHPGEGMDGCAWRWTKGGGLALSPEFWNGLSGEVAVLVSHNDGAIRRWVAPARRSPEAPSHAQPGLTRSSA